MNGSRIILAAHRGDRFNYPENTMPAFESAFNASVDMIETDVRMSKDGELVLMHDRSALRTTGIDKNIDEMTLSEIRSLDAGCTFKNPVITKIPTVREFLEYIKNANIMVNWEFKVYPTDFDTDTAFEVVDKLVKLIDEKDIIPCICIPDNIENYKTAIDYGCKMFTSNNIAEAARILSELKVR